MLVKENPDRKKKKRKHDTIGEVQQFIRMEMRKLGWLLGLGLIVTTVEWEENSAH